jgi:hypothetical protein
MSLPPKMSRPPLSAPTVEEVAKIAVDTVRPVVPQEQPEEIQIQIDPQMLQQAVMTKNARLIATMVHENALLEVALEQERRNSGEWQAKYYALQASLTD